MVIEGTRGHPKVWFAVWGNQGRWVPKLSFEMLACGGQEAGYLLGRVT